MALKMVESTSLMIGLVSAVMRSIERTSSPSLVLLHELDAEVLGRLVEHALRRSRDFCRISSIAERTPDLDLDRLAEQQLELVELRRTSAGSAMTTARRPGELRLAG